MKDYFVASLGQLVERALVLRSSIPRNLPRDYDSLAKHCAAELNRCIADLEDLAGLPLDNSLIHSAVLRDYRRVVGELDNIERFAIRTLERANSQDHRLNRLVERITREISYPLPTPIVSSLSQEYFTSSPYFNIVYVPLTEVQFLLHLPDLYHELCHFLLEEKNDPVVSPVQKAAASIIHFAYEYCAQEIQKLDRQRGMERVQGQVRSWMHVWGEMWAMEFICDLFAIATLGPAFAWSHFHLTAKRGTDPFGGADVGSQLTHPPDDARFRAMVVGLRALGFGAETLVLEQRWETLLGSLGVRRSSEYDYCFPDSVIEPVVDLALRGIEKIGCRMVDDGTEGRVHDLLNSAWRRFWDEPRSFAEWEKREVALLHEER